MLNSHDKSLSNFDGHKKKSANDRRLTEAMGGEADMVEVVGAAA